MNFFKTKLRRVGKSIGLLVPKAVVESVGGRPDQEVEVMISTKKTRRERERALREAFGIAKGFKVKFTRECEED